MAKGIRSIVTQAARGRLSVGGLGLADTKTPERKTDVKDDDLRIKKSMPQHYAAQAGKGKTGKLREGYPNFMKADKQ